MSVRALRTIRGKRGAFVSTLVTVALLPTVLVAAPAPAATPCGSAPATFPTSQMSAGMTGIGYTVLQGQTLVPFDVEILGVMPNAIYLGVDVVAAKITGPADFLATTGGAIAGMSGSPVYINGRLAGAVAWAIAEDRHIFGMTAAEDMVGMFSLPGASEPGSMPQTLRLTPAVRAAARSAGSPIDLGATLEALPVPLGVSGLSGIPLSEIETQFADQGIAVQAFRAGSVTAPSAGTLDPSHFRPGDGLGVSLSYGDVSYYGFGTTTAVCGDVAIGFGHPMFYGIGRVSLGMNEVNVIAIDNGTFFGTKIGVLGDAHGVLTQDRFAGVAGVFGGMPTIVPITSVLSSPDTGLSRQGETDVAWDDDFFVANTAFSHVYSNVTYVAQEDAPGTLALGWTISGTREGGAPFTVTNRLIGFSEYSASSEAYDLANVLFMLASNGFEDVAVHGRRPHGPGHRGEPHLADRRDPGLEPAAAGAQAPIGRAREAGRRREGRGHAGPGRRPGRRREHERPGPEVRPRDRARLARRRQGPARLLRRGRERSADRPGGRGVPSAELRRPAGRA